MSEETMTTEDVETTAPSSVDEESDLAADYVEELLDIADIDGDIDIEIRNGRIYLSVLADQQNERLQDLIGDKGKGLEALQELVRLAVLSSTGNRSRLILDIAGYRDERAKELTALAEEAIERVKSGEEKAVHLKPMSAYERKIVHDVIADAGLVSESEGESSRRHVIVSAEA